METGLVSVDWLAARLSDPGVRVLDAAWYLPVHNRNARADFATERIPSATFFDIEGIADPSSPLPHMLPGDAAWGAAMDALGITRDTAVVVYDHLGVFSAPRVWWSFKAFGHSQVAVLDGGLPAWKAAGQAVEGGEVPEEVLLAATRAAQAAPPAAAPASEYIAHLDTSKVRGLQDMWDNITSAKEQVMDARPFGRFVGTDPEPRPGLRGGHIPGALSLPFAMLLRDGRYKTKEELAAAFAAAGVDLERPVVGSCGTGLTACVLALGAYQVTRALVPLYDGSWTEWGGRQDTPVSTDPPKAVA